MKNLKLLTFGEVMERTGLKRKVLTQILQSGKLPYLKGDKPGSRIYISEAALEQWFEEGMRPQQAAPKRGDADDQLPPIDNPFR